MNTDPIRDQVKAYYETQQMSPASVERLKSLLSAMEPSKVAAKGPTMRQRLEDFINARRPRLVFTLATALAVMLMINLGGLYFWQGASESRLAKSIAREIALNHVKNLGSEYQVSSIEILGRVMSSLDFEPFAPDILDRLGLVFHGARYCSIQGYLAVQIILSDASGKRHTLYQAPCQSPLQKIQRVKMNLDNVQVTMWNESGVFMGLAGPLNAMQIESMNFKPDGKRIDSALGA